MISVRLLFGATLALVVAGCGGKPNRSPSASALDTAAATRTNVEQAFDMIARMDEFERAPARDGVVAMLSNHVGVKQNAEGWKSEPLLSGLPRNLRGLPILKHLDTLEIQETDPLYIEEAYLYRTIGNWAVKRPLPAELEAWLASQEAALGKEAAAELAAAYLLFDWTVRNIQLDPLPEPPKEAAAGPTGATSEALPPPLAGLPGPGYTAYPWYVAVLGHGDAWQRLRAFIMLARQQGMEVVVVAIPDAADATRLVPWTAGALVGGQLFLFEPAVGLPLPGPGGVGIATLEQLRKQPELIRALDVDADNPYEVSAAQLKSLTIWIDASLESLSLRMRIIEQGLSGSRQLRLTTQPSQLEGQLRKLPGVANVQLWPVPLETTLFEMALRHSPIFNAPLRDAILRDRLLYESRTQFSIARYRHLRGQFDDAGDKPGAKSLYIEARLPDALINDLGQNEDLQKSLGIVRELEKRRQPADREAYLKMIQNGLKRGKFDCSYWLGLCQYESEHYDTAVNWLDERTLKAAPTGWWTPGARYNLGRTYEMLNAPQLAQEYYLADDSPQRHGSLLRAKRLQKPTEKSSVDSKP